MTKIGKLTELKISRFGLVGVLFGLMVYLIS
jgi:hypothetical protein